MNCIIHPAYFQNQFLNVLKKQNLFRNIRVKDILHAPAAYCKNQEIWKHLSL